MLADDRRPEQRCSKDDQDRDDLGEADGLAEGRVEAARACRPNGSCAEPHGAPTLWRPSGLRRSRFDTDAFNLDGVNRPRPATPPAPTDAT